MFDYNDPRMNKIFRDFFLFCFFLEGGRYTFKILCKKSLENQSVSKVRLVKLKVNLSKYDLLMDTRH